MTRVRLTLRASPSPSPISTKSSYRRIVNVSVQLAVEAERVVEVEIEGADNRLREGVEAACTCDLEGSIDFRRERSAKNEGLGLSHSARFSNGSPTCQNLDYPVFHGQ